MLLHLIVMLLLLLQRLSVMKLRGDEQSRGGGGGNDRFVMMNRRVGVAVDAVGPVAVQEMHPYVFRRSQLSILQVTGIA